MFDVIVIGGGAAGFYGAIHIALARPHLKIAILERGKQVLAKVRISGGGRCNVTHAIFDPAEFVRNYPRGERELLGPLHKHGSADTVDFFESLGVALKTESDGRMFPVTDSSQTVIDSLMEQVERLGIQLFRQSGVKQIIPLDHNEGKGSETHWRVKSIKKTYTTRKVLLATGSNIRIWDILQNLGHTIVSPVPSLFTFNISDNRIKGLQGVSTHAQVEVLQDGKPRKAITVSLRSASERSPKLRAEGPLLITHWGMSGPAVLKLSAWGANILNSYNYNFRIRVNWIPEYQREGVQSLLREVKVVESRKTVFRTQALDLPRRLWRNLVKASGISEQMKWAEVPQKLMENLAGQLTGSEFRVQGKSTFKEEFVTAGGVHLKEINFKTFESKLHKNLFLAGEVINVDGITGGFNFQNAWTGAYIAAQAISKDL
ncbi:BaiN/RdsA family NAD(P)/FAD-dependent oxidoreductase [Poritiphilus flavus]|uniref:Aminoacetone oxidase family FAD-binding enzyme n=1 Tax=Poritiphilus flavus TaxID=2697053 RepID=A0A6L9EDI2_9FLAO|nr:NAD(P)/FAD-dependent oxidoreductase [Poritiphilus flavus]NAS12756.1 aminoacetone oxidase family FAD-binding enzyme [Poritiphilus flavus]